MFILVRDDRSQIYSLQLLCNNGVREIQGEAVRVSGSLLLLSSYHILVAIFRIIKLYLVLGKPSFLSILLALTQIIGQYQGPVSS